MKDTIKEKIDLFGVKNESYFSLYANYYYLIGEYQKGIDFLSLALQEKIPFSYEITYNLASLKNAIDNRIRSLWLF